MDTRAAGRTVAGRYRLLDRLGSGGMGTVWRGEDVLLGRPVAVKEVVFPHGVSEEEREVLRERTRREARTAAKLDHPSAVTVYDVAEEDGTPYLVMELVEARTLAEVVRSDGPLSPRDTAEVGLAVLGALEAAHEQGIVHRDVKPGNVLVRSDGRVVLTDFGIATTTGDSSITSTGLLLGSPSYIAPERARGEQPGPPSDLWSLGATLFTAVEGRAPYDKGEALPTMTAVVTGDHAPFVAAGPLAPVLEGLLEKDPEQRMTAEQACQALKAVLAADATQVVGAPPVAAPAPAETPPVTTAPDHTAALSLGEVREEVAHEEHASRSRTPLVVLAVTLLVIAAIGLLLVPSLRDSGKPNTRHPSGTSPSHSRSTNTNAIPAGWKTSSHDGWTVAVPASYAEGVFDGDPQYKDPVTRRTLRVSTLAVGKTDAVADRRAQAASFAASHPDYHEIGINKADYRGYEAADWEFTYSDGGANLHALDRVFVVNGRGYSLYFQTHSTDDWSAARADFDKIAAAFQP